MPKYLLLKHYRGGPESVSRCAPMTEWTPEEITAHMAFQREVGRILTERGEMVDAQALAQDGAWVRYGGPDAAPVVTDGPFPEAKELIAGWFLVDVESEARADDPRAWLVTVAARKLLDAQRSDSARRQPGQAHCDRPAILDAR